MIISFLTILELGYVVWEVKGLQRGLGVRITRQSGRITFSTDVMYRGYIVGHIKTS